MRESPIDLRSDTVTRPSLEMRAAMATAEVGDDVFGEDPTVNRLQEVVAALLGKEAALFVPSGTMANQIALWIQTQPGDEIICEATSHMVTWESGGPAALSGVMCRTVDGQDGILELDQIRDKVRPSHEVYARTRFVTLENTHNRGGGRVYPQQKVNEISAWARSNGLAMHLDGARIWNAHIATGTSLAELCRPFDSASVSFSKGLGAPIGSALVGSSDLIRQARRVRKMLGGGMRQAGIIAAAALYAVENNIPRLADDHRNAKSIGEAIRESSVLQLNPQVIETNLVWFEVDPAYAAAEVVADRLREVGVLVHVSGPTVLRACTHLDVSSSQAAQAAEKIRKVFRSPS